MRTVTALRFSSVRRDFYLLTMKLEIKFVKHAQRTKCAMAPMKRPSAVISRALKSVATELSPHAQAASLYPRTELSANLIKPPVVAKSAA